MKIQVVVLTVAVILLLTIIEVVRRRRLSENYALLWITVGIGGLLLGAARPLIDRFSEAIGIAFGTSLVFALAIVFLVIVCINLSVHLSKLEERVETLAHEVALLSAEAAADSHDPPLPRPPSAPDPLGPPPD